MQTIIVKNKIAAPSDKICFPFKIGTYNIESSNVGEKEKPLSSRIEKIYELVKEMDLDILGINETGRPTNDQKTNKKITAEMFLSGLKSKNDESYRFIMDYWNSGTCFANAIAYKPSKVYPINQKTFWLSETPDTPSDFSNEFGRKCLAVEFLMVDDSKIDTKYPSIWVYLTHLAPGDEKAKFSAVKLIRSHVIKHCKSTAFVMGDFNFFDDLEGQSQRIAMLEEQYRRIIIDSGSISKFSFDKNLKAYGTFLGFEYDKSKKDAESLFKQEKSHLASRLDHIFVFHCKDSIMATVIKNSLVYAKNIQELIERNTPSDHLPLVLEIEINFNSIDNDKIDNDKMEITGCDTCEPQANCGGGRSCYYYNKQ